MTEDAPKTVDDLFKAVVEMWQDCKQRFDRIETRLGHVEATLPNLATATDLRQLAAGQKALGDEIHGLKVAVTLLAPRSAA